MRITHIIPQCIHCAVEQLKQWRVMDEEPAGVNEARSMLSQPSYILNATSIIASGAWCQKALLTVCFIEITINCITYAFLPPMSY